MTPSKYILRKLDWFVEDLETMALQLCEIIDEAEELHKRFIPHYARDNNAKEDIANGKQTLLRDFE